MPFTQVTLATLRIGMADRWDGSVFWTPEEARLAINEALREWNLLTGRWRTSVTYSTGAGNPVVALGTSLVYGARVRLATGQPLYPTSTLELDLARPRWTTETTASGGDVPTTPTLWAPVSLQQIDLWPATAAAGTNNLLVEGVAATPVLVEDGDTVDLSEALHDTLLDYALHVAAFKEGGPRWRATLPYFLALLKAAAEENARLKTSQAFRRYAGLDQRRRLQPTRSGPTLIDDLGTALAGGGQ